MTRQLELRERLKRAGKIDHDRLFFKETGGAIRILQYPYRRWRHTLLRNSGVRYRRPYCARHTSVSWDLMVGQNPLWVAKQHGHSITTMLRTYAAWAENAVESDIEAIKGAMAASPWTHKRAATSDILTGKSPQTHARSAARKGSSRIDLERQDYLSVDLPMATSRPRVTSGNATKLFGGERGTRTLDPGIMSAVL
jgi:hypothetical protein